MPDDNQQPIEVGGDGDLPIGRTEEITTKDMEKRFGVAEYRAALANPDDPAIELSELRAVGDMMQSEASRIIEWISHKDMGDQIPYEVRMAIIGVQNSIERWTEIRRKSH